MPSPREYILGTADDEYARLGFQHRLWADLAGRTWRDARIAPGQTVLDLGCGPGYATFELAALVGGGRPTESGGRVYAVDESQTFIERLRAQATARGLSNITAHVADAHNLGSLPLSSAEFDLVYTRWVLCFVRDPDAIVQSIASLLKRGGKFCVNDYFNYEAMTLAPKRASFSRTIQAIAASWRSRGGDCDIVGRLPALCAKHGMRVTKIDVDQRIARPWDTMWQWPETFWRTYLPRLVSGGFLSQAHADEFFDDWRAASSDPDTFVALPPVYACVAERS